MPSVYDLKPRFQALLRPACGALVRAGVRPNHVTLAAAAMSLVVGGVLVWAAHEPGGRWALLVLPAVLLVRMALNAIDGMIAREWKMQSSLGAVLNELGDVVSDAALYLPLAMFAVFDAATIVVFVVLAIIGEMAGVLMRALGATRRYDGPMGKSDRALAVSVLALLVGFGVPGGAWLGVVVWLLVAAGALTILNRVRRGLKELPKGAA